MNPSSDRAGAALLRRRVEAYTEYARLLSAQEEAADAGDLDRLAELDDALDAVQAVLGSLPGLPAAGASPDPETDALLDRGREVLEQASATQLRLARKLRSRRDAARQEIDLLGGRRRQARSYMDGDAPSARLNVRF